MKVRPRALGVILNQPIPGRPAILAEGLAMLVEHIRDLSSGVDVLQEANRPRSSMILQAVAGEEAAKALILVDLIRLGWRDQTAARMQINCFSIHLARGIYAQVSAMNPGSFGEVREMVEQYRVSHYLDGPNDVDWVFRNEIEADREERLYVDYVQDEEDHRWHTPASSPLTSYSAWTATVELVQAMARAGLFTVRGLELTAAEWNGVALLDSTPWREVATRTHRIVSALVVEELPSPDFTQDDWKLLQEKWTFPMHDLDLSMRQVSESELQAKRDGWLASQW